MARLRVHNIAVSMDGYAAGPDQGPEDPLGVGGTRLHEWVFETPFGRRMMGEPDDAAEDGTEGVDDGFLARGEQGIGATIMGRNMFGPVRGPWPDDEWTGWWGDEPPYHHPVFVLTHHERAPLVMRGGTTFHFVTDGARAALDLAVAAAGGLDVRLGGGVATIRAFLRAGLVDELHLAVVPVLLGAGERLLDDVGGALDGYRVELVASPAVAHVVFRRD